jgi:5-methylcytosine-specific restriction endonuclease McrA
MSDALDSQERMRLCEWCRGDISHKRRDARFCDRVCKMRASDQRRKLDGRAHARDRARYSKEAEVRRAQAKAAYWRDAEARRQYAVEWRAANKEARRIQHQRRRARLQGNDSREVTLKDWLALLRIAGHRCTYCGAGGKLVMDHIIPLAKGGRHAIGNIAPACVSCNSSKSASLLAEWRYKLRRGGDAKSFQPKPHPSNGLVSVC